MITDPRCALGEALFSSVVVSANPAGLPITNLASTIDGTLGSDLSGFSPPVTEAQLVANPTTAFDYLFPTPVNGLSRLLWHNGGGGDLTDQDGFGLITVTFLDAGLLPLATMPWNLTAPAGNNAVARQLDFAPLSGVARVRFNGFHKQNTGVMGTGSPLLRQVEAFTTQRVFACRRSSGAVEWYDETGNLVPSSTVSGCEPCNPMIVNDLSLTGVAFDFAGGGVDEYLTITPLASSTAVGTVLVAPNHYHASAASTNSSCSGKNVRVTFLPASTFNVSYGGLGGSLVGGVFVQFSAPSLGGQLSFGPWAAGTFTPGQSKVILVPNGRATLTYVSGPVNANAPSGAGAQCGLGAVGTHIIGLHLSTVSTADQPIVFRLDFERCS